MTMLLLLLLLMFVVVDVVGGDKLWEISVAAASKFIGP
jgi:hypothetical protein